MSKSELYGIAPDKVIGKCPKISNTFICYFFWPKFCFFMLLFLKPGPAEPGYTLPLQTV